MLFSCIENLLRSLNVRNFVLPAADEAESLWTNKFGFKKIAEDEVCPFSLFTFFVTNLFTYMLPFFSVFSLQLKEYRKEYPLMVFQGTSMLHKLVAQS